MKVLGLSFLAGIAAGPVLAHGGAHVHPHDGASWLTLAAALAVLALAGGLARARARE